MIKTNLKLWKATAGLLAVALISINGFSQGLNLVNYTVQHGLAQSQVRTLNQDKYGNLWIGTIAGLSKYNGLSFKNYSEKDSLAEAFITSSLKDSDGNLWFGHWGGGLSKLDVESGKFTDLQFEKYTGFKSIHAIAEDASGNLWIGVDGKGVLNLTKNGTQPTRKVKGLDSINVTSLDIDKAGNVWVGTENGLYGINSSGEFNHYTSDNGLPGNEITAVLAGLSDEIWVVVKDQGIVRFSPEGNAIDFSNQSNAQVISTANSALTSNAIIALYEDEASRIWVSTARDGLLQFVPSSGDFAVAGLSDGDIQVFATSEELKFQHPVVMLQDREGNFWMGTDIGLNQYMGELFKLFNQKSGLTSNLVYTISVNDKDDIWVGTQNGASKISFNQENGKTQYHSPEVTSYQSELANNVVNDIIEAADGSVWFAHDKNGLTRLLPNGKAKTYGVKDGVPNDQVYAVATDKNGDIWIGTKSGAGKFDASTEKFELYNKENGLGGDRVFRFFKDSKGRLWFAILGGDITYFDGSTFKTFSASEMGVSVPMFYHINEDAQGNIWFVAYNDGLVKYDGSGFSRLTIKDGMSNNSPNFVISDAQNNLWLGQSTGLEKFDQDKNVFTFYGREEGFLGFETNKVAVAKDKKGNIWYGTIQGLVKFSPDKEVINEVEPITLLDKLQIRLEDAEFPEGNVFPYDQNYLTFHILGISLTSPSQVLYKYHLEGLSPDYTPPTNENTITYSSLPPGKYKLNVMASNNDGVWNELPTTYSFEITPPFWKTTWFYITCAVLVIVIVVFYVKWREKQLKARQIELEGIVDERTAELRAEKEIVEKQNHNITESISYAQRIQQAILPPMDTVKKLLPNSFIFYRPKDIVSGDFYWVHETKDKVLFAAVDCTGHGVPGAFMSLIGHNLLEQIVNDDKIYEPGKILDKLSKEITRTLRQDADASVKDGMDLAVCAIDKSGKKMEFAGAYNPAYVVRGEEVLQLKGDKLSIGSQTQINDDKNFENQVFDLEKGDRVYVFSDGYADQKGGPKGKKFYYAPFRDLLVQSSNEPIQKQRDILEKNIIEWMGSVEQYDDMLVFGVEI